MKLTKLQMTQIGRALSKELGINVKVKDVDIMATTKLILELRNDEARAIVDKYMAEHGGEQNG